MYERLHACIYANLHWYQAFDNTLLVKPLTWLALAVTSAGGTSDLETGGVDEEAKKNL